MAEIEVKVTIGYQCEHCEATVRPETTMYRNGPREVIRHQCPDGHIEREFSKPVAVTDFHIVQISGLERAMLLRNAMNAGMY